MSTIDTLLSQFSSEKVRNLTGGNAISAYLLPSTDAHQSEYLADFDFRVKFLTGFTGSNAFVALTKEKAALWTDSRYFVQAEKQLVKPWILMKMGLADSISVDDFLIENLSAGDWIGFDPSLHTFEDGKKMIKKYSTMGFNVIAIQENLVDNLWTNRPKLPTKGPIVLTLEEHGRSVASKLKELREKIGKKKCNTIVLSALDDIMWLLNIRGFDIKFNPLSYSYLLVTPSEVHLFMDKADDTVRAHLFSSGIILHPYCEAFDFMSKWNHGELLSDRKNDHKVFVPNTTNFLFGRLFSSVAVIDGSPVQVMKSIKNDAEMNGMRLSHIRDSAALIEFFVWLEMELHCGRAPSEIEAAYKVNSLRAAMDKFVDLSFSTISAVGDHAASPHYESEGQEGARKIALDQVYLLDSGAHYRDGTTDVTRTIWLKDKESVPEEFIKQNTLVLKGHIHLANTIFPQAVNGVRLDTLSRHAMWQYGLDFGHGTGHGVGHFLNVHEGPAGIGHRIMQSGSDAWIRERMVITIEPGFYLEGKWGIRIENCYEVTKAENVPSKASFLAFKSLTLVPIQTDIIDTKLLTNREVIWLNTYHDRVLSIVGDFLLNHGKVVEFEWLKRQCQHI